MYRRPETSNVNGARDLRDSVRLVAGVDADASTRPRVVHPTLWRFRRASLVFCLRDDDEDGDRARTESDPHRLRRRHRARRRRRARDGVDRERTDERERTGELASRAATTRASDDDDGRTRASDDDG